MRLANVRGRGALLFGDQIVDVERASMERLPSDPMEIIGRWDAFTEWAAGVAQADAADEVSGGDLGPPMPRPAKIFAIGANYRSHAAEAGMEPPKTPMVFTKFPNCLVGPNADVVLTSATVDWEVELVVVIGRRARRIPASRALEHVAGFCVGQDISDRRLQFADEPPQFSLGKSADTFGPIGPALVSIDSFAEPDDLAITCDVAGERMQDARTSDMIFGVSELVEFLSRSCTLEPGDLIFTGTPSGVGSTRDPRRYLKAGEEIVSSIEGVGTMVNRCVSDDS